MKSKIGRQFILLYALPPCFWLPVWVIMPSLYQHLSLSVSRTVFVYFEDWIKQCSPGEVLAQYVSLVFLSVLNDELVSKEI